MTGRKNEIRPPVIMDYNNILYVRSLRAKEQNDKWDQNLVNTNLEI